MNNYYLLIDNEDCSHHRTIIYIILYSGNCWLDIRIHQAHWKCVKKSLQRFLNVPHTYVVFKCLGEALPLEIKVKINQVIKRLIYFLEKICQLNWYRVDCYCFYNSSSSYLLYV